MSLANLIEITAAEVERVARLARLDLTPDEIHRYQKDLNAIVGSMEKLRQVDLSQVPATLGVYPHSDVFRKDEAQPSPGADAILSNAPHREGESFQIPRILEEV